MYYLYVLKSKKDGNFYTGSTSDLRKRFAKHNKGQVFSTRRRIPFEIIYYEAYKGVVRRTLQRELKDMIIKGLLLTEGATNKLKYKLATSL